MRGDVIISRLYVIRDPTPHTGLVHVADQFDYANYMIINSLQNNAVFLVWEILFHWEGDFPAQISLDSAHELPVRTAPAKSPVAAVG